MNKTDIVNMLCGQPFKFYAMSKAQQMYGKNICSYNDIIGEFKWNRHRINSMQLNDIVDLYENVKNWNREETAKKNTKIILNVATEKRCYFKCEVCGYERVAQEDRYCPMCGEKFDITE